MIYVIKRNGELVNFDRSKIYIAILGAFRDEKIKNKCCLCVGEKK